MTAKHLEYFNAFQYKRACVEYAGHCQGIGTLEREGPM